MLLDFYDVVTKPNERGEAFFQNYKVVLYPTADENAFDFICNYKYATQGDFGLVKGATGTALQSFFPLHVSYS